MIICKLNLNTLGILFDGILYFMSRGLKYQPSMRRGASDGKFLRQVCGLCVRNQLTVYSYVKEIFYKFQIGIPSIGFTAMANTPVLLHANDEYIHADTYLEGIRVYKEIIERLGNAE